MTFENINILARSMLAIITLTTNASIRLPVNFCNESVLNVVGENSTPNDAVRMQPRQSTFFETHDLLVVNAPTRPKMKMGADNQAVIVSISIYCTGPALYLNSQLDYTYIL